MKKGGHVNTGSHENTGGEVNNESNVNNVKNAINIIESEDSQVSRNITTTNAPPKNSKKTYMCPNCRRNFLYYKRALLCCTKVDRKFTYVCEVCETVINSKQNVQRHKKRCANIMKARKAEKSIETPNLCELCDKTFSTHTTLKRHKHEVDLRSCRPEL